MKPRILVMCQVPPPTTGAAMVGYYISQSSVLRERFDIELIPIQMAETVADLGKFTPAKIARSLGLFKKLTYELATRRYAAVYFAPAIAGAAFYRDVILVAIARAFGRRRILHIHMRGVMDAFHASAIHRACLRFMFSGADVIHLCKSLLQDLGPLVPPARQHVVANGIAVSPASNAEKERGPETLRRPIVLYLSNLMIEKGPLDLLEAALRLLRAGLRFTLIFVGAVHSAEVEQRIKVAAKEFPEAIFLYGPRYGEAKERLQREADIFAFPSYYRYECQSLAVIEAMANGLAILASKVGGTADLLQDGAIGLLHDLRDLDGIETGLRRLIEDEKLRQALGRAAREKFLESYTLETFERRLADTFGEILVKDKT